MPSPRKELIQKIEKIRKSHVITYVCGDRNPVTAQIGEDAVRIVYEHIYKRKKEAKTSDKLDLFLYSRGGDTTVPWRIISMLREHYSEVNVLVPYKAYSSATLISLGADNIIMGKKAELGPIDPTLMRRPDIQAQQGPLEISVEDVSSFITFIRERAGLTDQSAITSLVQQLAQSLTPLSLGKVARTHSHIRLVARKLLSTHTKKYDETKMDTIIETMCEKMYSHGHAIGRKEAQELGLPVVFAEAIKIEGSDAKTSEDLEEMLWALYLEYEKVCCLLDPIDIEAKVETEEGERIEEKGLAVALIESTSLSHIFKQDLLILKQRNLPQNLQLNINVNLQLPTGTNLNSIPQSTQQILQQIIQQASQQASAAAHSEIRALAPVAGYKALRIGQTWALSEDW